MLNTLMRPVFAAVVGLSGLVGVASAQATDLLPDIIIDQATLYDHVAVVVNGRAYIRLSNGTPNIGAGKLYLYGSTVNGDQTQDVVQRVYRTDGTFWDRLAGKFVYHPTHHHIHFNAWCQYRLRERIGEDGLGSVVAQGEKTSFCILDLQPYDQTLPGYNPAGQFNSCTSTVQGLSVGWMDVYTRDLEGQDIDITGVPDGNYWLESEADPEGHVLESNESNNISRIKITLTDGSTLPPDRYEPNHSYAEVDARVAGASNSPNLGPVGPKTVLTGLTISKAGVRDYFKFYMAGTGTSADSVRIDFHHQAGDLDLQLYNSAHVLVFQSAHSGTDSETVSLNGRSGGWYYLQILSQHLGLSPDYTLTIDPPANATPTVVVTDPPAGNIDLFHGLDAYVVKWQASDPDSDPTWVTVYLNTARALDGNEILIPTSLNTNGALGFHTVNSTYVEPGTYYAYCEVTDSGVFNGGWSPGTVTFLEDHHNCTADFNDDGFVNGADFDAYVAAFEAGSGSADTDHDGFVTGDDFDLFAAAFAAGC